MKQCSVNLLNMLNNNDVFMIADLLTFTLVTGVTYHYTSASFNLTINSVKYLSLPMKRGTINWLTGVDVCNLEMLLYPDPNIDMIGNLTMTEAFCNGTFDGAFLQLDKAFFSNSSATPEVLTKLFMGRVDVDTVSRNQVKLDVKSPTELLNIKAPAQVFQPQCGWVLYGGGCNVITPITSITNSGTTGTVTLPNGTISSLSCQGKTAYITTTSNHKLKTGMTATIVGGGIAVANGNFPVTVTGITTFTYTLPTPTNGTGTGIMSFSSPHNKKAGEKGFILGSTIANYNGLFTVKAVVNTFSFTFTTTGSGTDTNSNITLQSCPQSQFTFSSSVATGSTDTTIMCGLTQAQDYFIQGVWTGTSGVNANITRTIKSYSPGQITFIYPLLNYPAVGDTFTVTLGCQKTVSDCQQKFYNVHNFGGQPFLPLSEVIV